MTERRSDRDEDYTDVWTAVAIGAILGVGAILLVRARQEETTFGVVKRRLRPVAREARRAAHKAGDDIRDRVHNVGEAGEELLSASRDALDELRKGAREVVRATRDELRDVARDSVKEARKAARRVMH